MDGLRVSWLRYLQRRTREADEVAAHIIRNPFRVANMREDELASSRLLTVRTSTIGLCLGECARLLAARHCGCTVERCAGAFVIERPDDRIVIACQSRESSENRSNQKSKTDEYLMAQMGHPKRTYIVRLYCAETGIESEYSLSKDGFHLAQGPLGFHWLSGDPDCWAHLRDTINGILVRRDIRIAEVDYRRAVELALIDAPDLRISPENYQRSRYQLEQVLGGCAPVLSEQPLAELPPTVFDRLAELEEELGV
jgi:hypothetical protein